MKSKQFTHSILLLITALVWGISFVSQNYGGDALGSFTFNSIRSFLGGLILIPVILLLDKSGKSPKAPKSSAGRKQLFIAGGLCGIILCIASNFQQISFSFGATSGKAGFLTACYILIVPILGIFMKKHCPLNVWIGVFLGLIGLYLLCFKENDGFKIYDILLLICAFIFSLHIIVIDKYSPLVDGVRMACIQFFVCGILTAFPMIFMEMGVSLKGIDNETFNSWLSNFHSFKPLIPLLYSGFISCGVGYTLQIVGQEGVNPTVASLLLSFESVFSVLAGWIILGEHMSKRGILGCVLIFFAIIISQINFSFFVEKKENFSAHALGDS
ncbi:MAG: DMT family transporter [Lachnospiraceae bacterium]|nr:DMT family transporter [Lachnospiraceae bacterium]